MKNYWEEEKIFYRENCDWQWSCFFKTCKYFYPDINNEKQILLLQIVIISIKNIYG